VPAAATPPRRVVVLVSGAGTTLQALLEASVDPEYGAQVVAVLADRPGTAGMQRARAVDVPTQVVRFEDYPARGDWDVALAAAVAAYGPDLVVCAGFMRILGREFLQRVGCSVVNTHPALLPSFAGAHGVRDALAYGVKVTGATVHFVDAGIDTGPVIAQAPVAVEDDDDVALLHGRIQAVERPLLVETVGRLARGGWFLDGRKVTLS
jgi:phosphoribosylglycinamide formyltransferase-1